MKSIQYIKFLVIASVIIIASQSIHAQSRYFDERYLYTEAHLSPQLINPGAYGSTPQQQILVNYRNKWAGIDGAPSTLTLSYNGPVGNGIDIGVNVLSDRFGSLETTKGAFGVSYSIKSPTNQIGFGISAEYIKHGLLCRDELVAVDDLGLPQASVASSGTDPTLREPSRDEIEAALARTGGVVAEAAHSLGLSRQALHRRMEKSGIDVRRE